jgi:hypothetical protein
MQSAGHEPTVRARLSSPRIRKRLLNLLVIILLVRAIIFIIRAVSVIAYPYEWSTMDGYFVFYGLRLVSGQPIYFGFGYESILMPFEYVPLYPAVIGILARLFGPAVWYERCFSLACSVAIGAIIYSAVAKRTGDRRAATVAGLLFFAPSVLSVWYLVRGLDVLALLLAVAGVYWVARDEGKKLLHLALPTALLVVAFFAKQTTVFQSMAALVFVFSRDKKRGTIMATGYAVAVLGFLLLFQLITGGWFFENTFLTTSSNPFYVKLFLDLFKEYALYLFIAFPLALWQTGRGISRRPDMWSLYLVFSLIATLLAGKIGAAQSYFLPLLSATCICLGLFLAELNHTERRPLTVLAILLLLLVQGAVLFRSYVPVPTVEDRRQAALLSKYIEDNAGDILIERIDSFATLNKRELNVEAVQLPILVLRGKVDIDVLTQAIRDREFALIIYSGIYFGGIRPMKEAVFENYEVVDRVRIGLFYGSTTFLVLSPR